MADDTIAQPIWTVYQVTNSVNGKLYFGLTKRGQARRWQEHLIIAANPKDRNHKLLHRAIRKHGADKFIVETVATGLSWDQARRLETEMIALHISLAPLGYNATTGGESNHPLPETIARVAAFHRGRKRSAETRARIAAAAKGRKPSPAAIAKTAAANRGRKRSAEFRAKMSADRKGKRRTNFPEELKARLRTAFSGKNHSVATKERMRQTQKARMMAGDQSLLAARTAWSGQKHTPEAKAKMSAARKGKSHPHTAQSKAKIGAANRGKVRSHEARQKYSVAAKRWHANRLGLAVVAVPLVPSSTSPPEALERKKTNRR
jgi:group I intron endonuclease